MSQWALNKTKNVFFNTFIILIVSTIIPVIIVNSIIYYYFTSVITNQTYEANVYMMEKANRINDLIIKMIDETMSQMAQDINFVNFVVNPDIDYYNSRRNNDIINNLKNMVQSNEVIESAYAYSNLSNILLESNGEGYSLDNFYDKQWVKVYNEMIEPKIMLETRKVGSRLSNAETDCITLIMNLPYESSSKLGALVVNIKADSLYKNISVSNSDENTFFVMNKEGEVILHRDKHKIKDDFSQIPYIQEVLKGNNKEVVIKKIDGAPMLVAYATSPVNGWKYVNIIPMNQVRDSYKFISSIVIAIMCLYIIIAVTVSYRISRGIYNPIQKLVTTASSISPVKKSENEYEYLHNTYNNVIDKYKHMEHIVEGIKPIIKEKLLANIILGKVDNLKEIEEKLDFIELDLELNNFVVILMQIDSYHMLCERHNEKERNIFKFQFINAVERIISKQYKVVCIEIESDKFAALVNLGDNMTATVDVQKSISLMARILKNEVELNFPFTITTGIGKIYRDIKNVNLSYKEAVTALKYKIYQGKNKIINIDDVEDGEYDDELHYDNKFEFEKERLLLNNIKRGSKEEVGTLLKEFFDKIMNNKNISFEHMKQGLTNVISSIIEIIINKGLAVESVFGQETNLYKEISSKETIEDLSEWFTNICCNAASEIEKVTLSSTSRNIQKILDYIDANLEKEITLNEVAEEVGLSVTYISKIFKNSLNVKYIDYVNSSRVEKAKSLLINTKVPIKEVGFKVGFNNIQTFIRVFKKYEGITPGKFRDND